MKIDEIITESINEVITEGYAGKDLEPIVDTNMNQIGMWLSSVKRRKSNTQFCFSVPIDVGKYGLRNKEGKRVAGIFDVPITLEYRNDISLGENGVGGMTEFEKRAIKIALIVSKEAKPETIKSVLLHELTHAVDALISKVTGYKTNSHQPNDTFMFGQEVSIILYRLWDTSEFNAWQSYGDLNNFVETTMEYLEKANEINDTHFWEALGGYLMMNHLIGRGVKMSPRNMRNGARVKKYFINTSFNKLKKFIKKFKL